MKLLIIIPAFNESENIVRVIDELRETVPQYDYVIVNDGSADNTAAICRENGYHMLDLPANLGLTGAFQTGMRYAYEKGYDAAIQIDADGQHDPKYIPDMVRIMEEKGADMVIGSRFVTEKKPHTLRMFGNTIIEIAIRLTTGKRLTDIPPSSPPSRGRGEFQPGTGHGVLSAPLRREGGGNPGHHPGEDGRGKLPEPGEIHPLYGADVYEYPVYSVGQETG